MYSEQKNPINKKSRGGIYNKAYKIQQQKTLSPKTISMYTEYQEEFAQTNRLY